MLLLQAVTLFSMRLCTGQCCMVNYIRFLVLQHCASVGNMGQLALYVNSVQVETLGHVQEWVSEMQNPDSVQRAKALEQLRNQILPLVRCTRFSDLPKRCLPQMELQIPVPLSVTQAESYRITLAKQYEQLGNHKAQRHSGQRASMLRSLCADICRVCNHPYTLEQFEPEADSQRHIADYVQVRSHTCHDPVKACKTYSCSNQSAVHAGFWQTTGSAALT